MQAITLLTPLLRLTQVLRTNQAGTVLYSTLVSSRNIRATRTLTASGDQQAVNGMFFDLSDGPPRTSRYLVPRTSKRSQRPEDLAFLRMKGCFSLPSQSVCEELVCRYFQLVHPSLPVIDAGRFLDDFVNRYIKTNLLVLWSMFFAATSVRWQIESYHVIG